MRTSREKLENSKKVVSREMVCFEIMKLVYNKTNYIKPFNINIIESSYFKLLSLLKHHFLGFYSRNPIK